MDRIRKEKGGSIFRGSPGSLARLITFFACAIWAITFAHLDPDWHHDGILFKPAIDVASGLSLFSETYTQYGAFTTFLQAAAIKIFGAHLVVLRIQAAGFVALSGVLFWVILRKIVPAFPAVITIFLWLIMAPYLVTHHWPYASIFSLFFMMAGALALIIGVEQSASNSSARIRFIYLLSGFCFALCFWTKQPTGIVIAPISLYFLIAFLGVGVDKRSVVVNFLFLVAGFCACNTILLGFLFATDSLDDWWLQSIVGAALFASEAGASMSELPMVIGIAKKLFPNPATIWAANHSYVWTILPVLNLIVVFSCIARILRRQGAPPQIHFLMVFALMAVGSWGQYFPVLGVGKVYWSATPMFGTVIAGGYLALKAAKWRNVAIYPLLLVLLGLFIAPDIQYRFATVSNKFPSHSIVDFPTLEGMRYSKNFVKGVIRFSGSDTAYYQELADLGRFVKNVRTIDPQLSLITITEDAYLPTVFAPRNPHPVTVWWKEVWQMYPDHAVSLKRFIREAQPLIEIKTKPWGWDAHNWADSNNPARERLGFSHYEVLFESRYSDSGTAQILASPELTRVYHKLFGIDEGRQGIFEPRSQ